MPIQVNTTTPASTTVTKVEFFVSTFTGPGNSKETIKLGEDNTAPYAYTWTIPAGQVSYNELNAVVTNSASNTAISSTIRADVYKPDHGIATTPRKLYVSEPLGSTANNGLSVGAPFKNIQQAAEVVQPGDTVFVMAGTYTNPPTNLNGDLVLIKRTGTPARWIVFTAYQNDKPKLMFVGYQGFNVVPGTAYNRIQGFEIVGNNANLSLPEALTQVGSCSNPGTALAKFNGNGISISGRNGSIIRPHHIVVANNIVHDCPGGGISAIESDYVTVENNTIYNTSWYTVFGSSGISYLNTWNYDSHADGTPSMIIRNNRTFRNQLYVPWVHGTPRTCDIYDGNGIILDNNNGTFNQNPLGAYTGKFLIENNLSYLNGGRGINLNYTDNVTLLNNTTYQNGASSGGPRVGVESELIMSRSSSARIYNNIFYGRANEKTIDITNATDVLHNNNLTFGGTGTSYFTGAQNKTGVDPQFINAPTMVDFDSPNPTLVPMGDFQLAATSPALNAGSSAPDQYSAKDILGVNRPQGAGVDMGAFERQADAPAPGPFAIAGVTTVSCQTVSAGLRSVRFTPQYAGVSGQPISFSVVNELSPTTTPGPYTLNLYTDNPVVTLKAVQAGTVGEASFSYNWLVTCTNGSARLGTEDLRNQLTVKLLGNPVREQVVAEITGVSGQLLQVQLTDSKGRLIESRSVEQGSTVERHIFDLRRQATGMMLLRVSTNRQTTAVKVLKQ